MHVGVVHPAEHVGVDDVGDWKAEHAGRRRISVEDGPGLVDERDGIGAVLDERRGELGGLLRPARTHVGGLLPVTHHLADRRRALQHFLDGRLAQRPPDRLNLMRVSSWEGSSTGFQRVQSLILCETRVRRTVLTRRSSSGFWPGADLSIPKPTTPPTTTRWIVKRHCLAIVYEFCRNRSW